MSAPIIRDYIVSLYYVAVRFGHGRGDIERDVRAYTAEDAVAQVEVTLRGYPDNERPYVLSVRPKE